MKIERVVTVVESNRALIAMAIVLILSLIIPVIIIAEKKKYRIAVEKVKENSARYLYLIMINDILCKGGVTELEENYISDVRFSTKQQYDNRDVPKCIKSELRDRWDYYLNLLKCTALNIELTDDYNKLLLKIPPYDSVNPDKRYVKAEMEITDEYEKRIQPVVPTFIFNFIYCSPKGRNYYQNSVNVDYQDMIGYYKQIKEDEKHKTAAQYERSKMSMALRYDVMKRDHFRCVLCGRSAEDGVKMHIDHIVPVAKGGKTTLSNLRTLCEDCNRGKRDKYDENGEN